MQFLFIIVLGSQTIKLKPYKYFFCFSLQLSNIPLILEISNPRDIINCVLYDAPKMYNFFICIFYTIISMFNKVFINIQCIYK